MEIKFLASIDLATLGTLYIVIIHNLKDFTLPCIKGVKLIIFINSIMKVINELFHYPSKQINGLLI